MGLAVLPARLKKEVEMVEECLINREIHEEAKKQELEKHIHWINHIREKYTDINTDNVGNILKEEVGIKFMSVLEHAGVFKRNEEGQQAFFRFLKSIDS